MYMKIANFHVLENGHFLTGSCINNYFHSGNLIQAEAFTSLHYLKSKIFQLVASFATNAAMQEMDCWMDGLSLS